MRNPITYFFLVIIISGTASWLFYKEIDASRIRRDDFSSLDYSMKSHEFNDLIFLGGSRVRYHINPAIIDSILGVKSYAISINGLGIVECNLLLTEYLKNHPKPKAVFLNIDLNMFYTKEYLFNLYQYFPYLDDTTVYRCLSPYKLAYRNKAVQWYYLADRLFARTDWEKKCLLLHPEQKEFNFLSTDAGSTRGFSPLERTWVPGSEDILKFRVNVVYKEEGFDLLKSIFERCRRDSIKVILLYSPSYQGAIEISINGKEMRDKINGIASRFNIPVWDYQYVELSHSKDFFDDPIHLNGRGAKLFSYRLATDIKKKFYTGNSSFAATDSIQLLKN